MLGAVGHPLHRAAGTLGRDQQQRIFAIHHRLGAETAADIGRDDTQLLGRIFRMFSLSDARNPWTPWLLVVSV